LASTDSIFLDFFPFVAIDDDDGILPNTSGAETVFSEDEDDLRESYK
jgi:hypothetical protein